MLRGMAYANSGEKSWVVSCQSFEAIIQILHYIHKEHIFMELLDTSLHKCRKRPWVGYPKAVIFGVIESRA